MTTVHANSSRDAISRLETMVLMAGFDLPVRAIREQIAAAIDVILQVTRLPDGRRIISAVTEVQGMEGDVILLQDIFTHRPTPDGKGELVATGLRPKFLDKLAENKVEVPASVFRAPTGTAPGSRQSASAGKARKVRVPTAREVAERERLR